MDRPYYWSILVRKIIGFFFIVSPYVVLVLLSFALKEESYYLFVTNSPFGGILYFSAAFRYVYETSVSIMLDIGYFFLLFGMMLTTVLSCWKKWAFIVACWIIAVDVMQNLLLGNFTSVFGDIFLLGVAIFVRYYWFCDC